MCGHGTVDECHFTQINTLMNPNDRDLHGQLYHFFNDLPKKFRPRDYVWDYRRGDPVPFIVLDDFLPGALFEELSQEVDQIPQHLWTNFTRNGSRMIEANVFSHTPSLTTLAHCFNSGMFLDWLENLTGMTKLISDPHMIGAGISRTTKDQSLKLHTDFNWNDELALNRCLSLILYLNPQWQDEWGGALQFWDFDRQRPVQTISCRSNRLLIWNYHERLYHGYPDPLACPDGQSRCAFRVFYYQSDARPRSEPHRSLYWYDEQNKRPYDQRDQT